MTVTIWRRRSCGKWSTAKRDPIRHKRWHHEADGFPPVGWFVWCGPFDRWTAQHDDPSPRPTAEGLGEPVSKWEREAALAGDVGGAF